MDLLIRSWRYRLINRNHMAFGGLMPSHSAYSVRGSPEFVMKFNGLYVDDRLRKEVDQALDLLKQNILAGEQIRRELWPEEYVRNYGISNLYRYALRGGHRLTYTILSEKRGLVVVILDLLSHKEYERLFGY